MVSRCGCRATVVALLMAHSCPALAETQTIAFQARLTNAAGATVPDGLQTMTFRLYDQSEVTTTVPSELHTFTSSSITLAHGHVVPDSETVARADGSVTYARGVAYTIDDNAGTITRVSAAAIPDNTLVRVFYRYTAAILWEETKAVKVTAGAFTTALGDTQAFSTLVRFGRPLFLGVQVGTDPEMSPRMPLAATPAVALPFAGDTPAAVDIPAVSITNSSGGPGILGHSGQPGGLAIDVTSFAAGVWGDGNSRIGVFGTSSGNVGVEGMSDTDTAVRGLSTSGNGVVGSSGSGDGVYGFTAAVGGGNHASSVKGFSGPGAGVGVFAGDLSGLGFAGFETNFSRGTTHIWCGENGKEVFSVTAGGAVCGLSFNQCSDARYKRDVQTLQNPLESVLALRGVSFRWNPAGAARAFPAGKQIGFIAQEVEKVLPEVVTTDRDGSKSVAYQNIVPVLVEAVKAQERQIAARDSRIAALEARLGRLEHTVGATPTARATAHLHTDRPRLTRERRAS